MHAKTFYRPLEREKKQELMTKLRRLHALAMKSPTVTVTKWEISRQESILKSDAAVPAPSQGAHLAQYDSYNRNIVSVLHQLLENSSEVVLVVDGQRFAWLINQLFESEAFRQKMIATFFSASRAGILKVCFLVVHPTKPVLDKLGNMLSNSHVSVKCEMETALSWLSTLGGAFSALGDVSSNFAVEAGHLSLKQLKIAMKLQDPTIQSRCRLYMALSLTQLGRLKAARTIVESEYKYAVICNNVEPRLKKMCLGVWSKLQYTWKLRSLRKKLTRMSSSSSNNGPVSLNPAKTKPDDCSLMMYAQGDCVGVSSS